MVFITIVSCTKTQTIVEQPTAPKGILNIQISHEVDGKALIFDSMIYHNKANNFYSISRVNYYISNVKLWGNGNNNYYATVFSSDDLLRKDHEIIVGEYNGAFISR